jgi:hypothetical protein
MVALTQVIESIETTTLAEAEKHGKSFDFKSARIEVKELGSKWHFDKSNDSKYFSIKSNIEKLDIERKEYEIGYLLLYFLLNERTSKSVF